MPVQKLQHSYYQMKDMPLPYLLKKEKPVKYLFQEILKRNFFPKKQTVFFARPFFEKALHDPITNEVGKTIIFAVSQNHARKLTEILNEFAEQLYPGKYNSDFAVQVTSQVGDAQQMTINFTNNNLNGKTTWLEGYKSSKTRVCVTVGMMTTGYDCRRLAQHLHDAPNFQPGRFCSDKRKRNTKKYF